MSHIVWPRTLGECASLACFLEARALKPGNVHPNANFHDTTYFDFVQSAAALAPVFDLAGEQSVGQTILNATLAIHQAVGKNTYLGTVMLLAPLAAVPRDVPLDEGIGDVLDSLSISDTEQVYEAIRIASPGGLGKVEIADVHNDASLDATMQENCTINSKLDSRLLCEVMALAADRDLVAKQFTNCFSDILGKEGIAAWLRQELSNHSFQSVAEANYAASKWNDAIVRTHLRWMAKQPDSLIARKCGQEIADESAKRAGKVLAAGEPESQEYQRHLALFDRWLREDGNRRNPGTTADFIAAGLFVLHREACESLHSKREGTVSADRKVSE